MTLDQFVVASRLLDQDELGKATLLAYYYHEQDDIEEFSVSVLCDWFTSLALARPNSSRLRGKLISRNGFVRGASHGSYRLSAKKLRDLRADVGELFDSRMRWSARGPCSPMA